MEGDIVGVRISPSVLEFFHTEPNTVYQLNVSVKNVSKDSKDIRYYGPKSKNFSLKVKNPDKPVAPGLGVLAVVEYQTTEEKEIQDRLVVTVDGTVIDVPLHAYPSRAALELGDIVDFGNAVANSKVIAKEITLFNHGSKSGEFKLKYSGNRPISIIPNSGSVPPKSKQKIKVEYVADEAATFDELAVVKLQGEATKNLRIKGKIVERSLELLSIDSEEPLECIKFGTTYYGTDLTQCAMLFNNGPEPINFVAVLDEDAIAQELGIDLTQSTTATLAEEVSGRNRKGDTNVLTSLITAIPNQGILKPYQKIPIFFRFSPRWNASNQGWKGQVNSPPRKDFAIFMRLEIVGSISGFQHESDKVNEGNVSGNYAEVSLTGTALPVLLSISPSYNYNFGECSMGESADVLCTMHNDSTVLPATFVFRHIAHFNVHPSNGMINPGQTQDIIFSFSPNQVGSFKSQQLVYVIGHVADKRNPTMAHPEIISTMTVGFKACSNPVTKKHSPRFNPGITPYITNEVGLYVDTTFSKLQSDKPRNAVIGATKTRFHHLQAPPSTKDDADVLVAFPNDQAQSIKPTFRKERYQTIFTKRERHNYVDPDYAYTDEELTERKTHRSKYIKMFKTLRERRISRVKAREFRQTNNKTDIGIKSAAGLKPLELAVDEIKPDPSAPVPPNAAWKLLSTKELISAQEETMAKPVRDGLNAVPTSLEEKRDCNKILTPQQLHQVVIGPPVIDFGNVCLRSTSQKHLNIVNNLNQYIHVVSEIDCRELRQSSPLSQVVPPKSKATIPILFESNTKGKFQRSVMYTVNGFYKHHVTIVAEVVAISLKLSTDKLVLRPSPGMPAEAGFRGVITLYNHLNYPAEFTWSPNIGEKGTAFSIRPATGVVNPFQDLDCEVVWHPSYMAPEDGSFTLICHGGNTLQFECQAELGTTSVQFVERRVTFGQVPVNLTTTRTALLNNNGHNHAYFQVLDPNPFPGLTVSPVHGMIPVGGFAELCIALTPDAVLKFDTHVQVAIKGSKTIELRMGGTVEPPCVEIDVSSFNLGGVYCGSGSTLLFHLTNKTGTKAKVEFDLVRYNNFTLAFPGYQTIDDFNYQMLNPGMFSVTLAPKETADGELTFMPTEGNAKIKGKKVAAYDFLVPVVINHIGAPSPAPTPFPPTPAPSQKNSLQHIINPRPQPFTVSTPRKHVVATALRQPLQLSTNRIDFFLPASCHGIVENTGVGEAKNIIVVNNSNKMLSWGFDLSKPSKVLDQGIIRLVHPSGVPFTSDVETPSRGIEGELDPGQTQEVSVLFCPKTSGKLECLIPVVINHNWEKPYQYLQIYAELRAPKIWFHPPAICLTPSPLLTEVSCDFNILCSQYKEVCKLEYELPEVECEDGSKISPLTLTFPSGQDIKPCCGDEGQIDPCSISCKVTFKSPKPVSFSKPIIFKDNEGKSFSMMVTATADNCLLTCYPFLALHRDDHKIVCEQGLSPKGHKLQPATIDSKENGSCVGEAVFLPCVSPNNLNSRPSTSATSSNFQVSASSYETDSISDSADSTPKLRDGAMNKPPSCSERDSRSPHELASRLLGSVVFPDEDSEEGIFHMEVLLSAQRWFSSMGWPNGPFPILIPESLRGGISHKLSDREQKGKGSVGESKTKKDCRTIYDMITHLSGRPVPGIPFNSALPFDPIERVKQIFWRHSTLLTFLKCQGACVAAIKPEHLMQPQDYNLWKHLQSQLRLEQQEEQDEEDPQLNTEEELDEEVFEAVSKRAWTDVLLQILKCLVLAKVTPRTLKSIPSPDRNISLPTINPDPLSSNIYSVGERIILTWLNHNYEHYRHVVWKHCEKGGIPSSRWIVNYDFDILDGLVIGAVLGAHLPFLIKSHLEHMFTYPATSEQCLHNALCVVNAMRMVGIDYDIQAIDITDPNPIALLLLCIHLFQRLPQYLPKASMEFAGALHSTVTRQVKLSNPSQKPLTYQVLVAGRDARDFRVARGDHVTVPARSTLPLSVEFVSRFLRPAEAILVLVGRRQGSGVGTTLTFNLRTQIDNITPKNTVKVESPCYELERILLDVTNPFDEGGNFRVVLVESNTDLLDPNKPTMLNKPKQPKKKKVKSRINHGQADNATPPTPSENAIDSQDLLSGRKIQEDSSDLSAFFSPMSKVFMKPHSSTEVEIQFLPFSVGNRQCSVIFLNEDIGEFLYSIEAKSTLPLPSVLPFLPTPHSVRISSAAAAGSGKGVFGGDDRVVYWKCEAGQILHEKLLIPITNMVKERALILAAQQHMSDIELQRRHVTGTLMSCSITAKTIKMLSSNPDSLMKQAKNKPHGEMTYSVEGNSEYFKIPHRLCMPSPLDSRSHSAPPDIKVPKGLNLEDGVVELPVTFKATDPGHYPCEIVVTSPEDVRVYRIECTVNPQGNTAEMEFSAPVHQSVTQLIPIINMTNHDWQLQATLVGEGFFGPLTLFVKAYQKANYPLGFRPFYEKKVQGKLVLSNADDGTDHTFYLSGKANKPLALENIQLDCQARKSVVCSVMVPNITTKKLIYHVNSDLPFVTGPKTVTVLGGHTETYEMTITPNRRGFYKGIVTLVVGRNPVVEVDSDGDEVGSDNDERREYDGYRIWYSLELNVSPPPPERSLEVTCHCQEKAILDVIVRNPTVEEIVLDATIHGHDLSGPDSITIPCGQKDAYRMIYSPSAVGKHNASLVFFNDIVGEFWYDLTLIAKPPPPTTMKHMECELGRWTKQLIVLENPTDEMLELIATISNCNNFSLERDNERPIILSPHSKLEIPLHFMPSTLGVEDHKAQITFTSKQFGDWVFYASGTGLLPQPQDTVSVYTGAGSNTSLIIPFRNPFDVAVLADVIITDRDVATENAADDTEVYTSPFNLLLKHNNSLRIGPKSVLDIPISFAPSEMQKYESLCTVIVHREDGLSWQYVPLGDDGMPIPNISSGGLPEIRWLYPIKGIPESKQVVEGIVIECRCREKMEERLEVSLAGVAASSAGPQKLLHARAKTPEGSAPLIPDGIVVGQTLATTDEFSYEISYGNEDVKKHMSNSLILTLIRQHRDPMSGLVVLVFNVEFNPLKPMSHDIELYVTAATGGLWKFPLRLVATEAPVDDTIMIEATGLNKMSSVGFRLNSQSNYAVAFKAGFETGGDPEFHVSPETGELLPPQSEGTLFTINFQPAVYGKLYQAKLIIQTTDMQWSYNIKGVVPEYAPPHGKSSRPMAGPHPDPRIRGQRIRYIHENIKLSITAVSSPVKGAPLLTTNKVH